MNVYTQWKKYLENNQPTAADMAAYAIARSFGSDDGLSKALHLLYAGFTPIKNQNRLLNGEYPYSTLTNIIGHSSMATWSLSYCHNAIKGRLKTIFEIEDSEELSEFLKEISKSVEGKFSTPYSYVLVRKDLDPAQKVVQSCHAIQEVTMLHPDKHDNTHMVVLQVPDEFALKNVATELKRFRNLKHHIFFESEDVGYTAIATAPISHRYLRKIFANFELLK